MAPVLYGDIPGAPAPVGHELEMVPTWDKTEIDLRGHTAMDGL